MGTVTSPAAGTVTACRHCNRLTGTVTPGRRPGHCNLGVYLPSLWVESRHCVHRAPGRAPRAVEASRGRAAAFGAGVEGVRGGARGRGTGRHLEIQPWEPSQTAAPGCARGLGSASTLVWTVACHPPRRRWGVPPTPGHHSGTRRSKQGPGLPLASVYRWVNYTHFVAVSYRSCRSRYITPVICLRVSKSLHTPHTPTQNHGNPDATTLCACLTAPLVGLAAA